MKFVRARRELNFEGQIFNDCEWPERPCLAIQRLHSFRPFHRNPSVLIVDLKDLMNGMIWEHLRQSAGRTNSEALWRHLCQAPVDFSLGA